LKQIVGASPIRLKQADTNLPFVHLKTKRDLAMKLLKLATLLTTCIIPTIGFATTPDPAAQRDFTGVDMPGGGHYFVFEGRTWYFTAGGVRIECTDDWAPCKRAMEIDEAPPPGPPNDPAPEEPPPEEPPKKDSPENPTPEDPPKGPPTNESAPLTNASAVLHQADCDVYINSPRDGEICAIADDQVSDTDQTDDSDTAFFGQGPTENTEFKTTGILWICPINRDCYFADFRSKKSKNEILVPIAQVSRLVIAQLQPGFRIMNFNDSED